MNTNDTAPKAETSAQMGGDNRNAQSPVQGDPLDAQYRSIGIGAVSAAAGALKTGKGKKKPVL